MDYISVSELPVDIFEVTPETDKIISQLGTLPLHIRQSPSGANLSEIYSDVNSINLTVIKHQTDQSAQSDLWHQEGTFAHRTGAHWIFSFLD